MKTLEYYKNLDYKIIVEKKNFENETYFVCYSEELGKYSCFGQGEVIEEAIENYYSEKNIFIESLYNAGLKIPEPDTTQEDLLSGVFNVRTDPFTHTNISQKARKNNLSLNQYVNKLLHEDSILSQYHQEVSFQLEEMKNLILKHDGNVKQQFEDLLLNRGLRKIASSMKQDKGQDLAGNLEFKDLAA